MFEKFGEFDSAEELNMAAEGLKTEGDIESLKALAAENGIDEMNVEDYLNGDSVILAGTIEAAFGKLDVEENENAALFKNQELVSDWIAQIRSMMMEDENKQMAAAVRKKGKSLKECIGEILKWAFQHQVSLHQDLLKAAGVNAGRVTMGVPGMRTAKELIRKYYLG